MGSPNPNATNSIVFGETVPGSLASDLFRDFWLRCIELLHPTHGLIGSHELSEEIDPEFEYRWCVGWHTYLASRTSKTPCGLVRDDRGRGTVISVDSNSMFSYSPDVLLLLGELQSLLGSQGLISKRGVSRI